MNLFPAGTKTTIPLPAEAVDAANDAVKFVVVLLFAFYYNMYAGSIPGVGGFLAGLGGSSIAGTSVQGAVVTGTVLALGFAFYEVVVSKLIMFVPAPGQATYYMSLKHA